MYIQVSSAANYSSL